MYDSPQLAKLRHDFQLELQKLVGNTIYIKKGTNRWGCYKHPGKKGNFCNIIPKKADDIKFPNSPFPHLQIATGKKWADEAGVKPGTCKPEQWRHDCAAYWCIWAEGTQFDNVVRDVSRIYKVV